ncbi:MAG: phosphoribosyltransferase [Candidatus Freyarchaeota archaeon]|nr:phosphoribosyltransferase family protein [Candidatus Freyarchaeota archaeon]
MKYSVFKDREHAGRELGKRLAEEYTGKNALVLAIPRGGVPVGVYVALELDAELNMVITRKIQIPWNPEAGFGAVTVDGTIVLNEPLVLRLGLGRNEIEELAARVVEEIKRRTREFRGNSPPPRIRGRTVIIVDDGLASGYTMIAAVKSVRKESPKKIVVAVPVSPRRTLNRVEKVADELVCLIVSDAYMFAVADYYENWYDLTDDDVKRYMEEYEKMRKR